MTADLRLFSSLQWLRYEYRERSRIVSEYRTGRVAVADLTRQWQELDELWRDYRLIRLDLYRRGYIPYPDF